MTKDKINIITESRESVEAFAPVIISASRSTDIPAFYSDWFFNRIKKGYCAWFNPFNGQKLYVAFNNVHFIVFWSKNPRPILSHLGYLKNHNLGCYFQYTLNDYVAEGLEKGVPNLQYRIDTFKMLVDKLGLGHVIWRFDPLILTDKIRNDDLLEKINNIGNQLKGYTEKLIFSFADIANYSRVKANLVKNDIHYIEWEEQTSMMTFVRELASLNQQWGYELATCGEKEIFTQYGIKKNSCVDGALIERLCPNDRFLRYYLHTGEIPVPDLFGDIPDFPSNLPLFKDKGQRKLCGCMDSKDVGEYNTCPHQCEYCYANTSKEAALKNYQNIKNTGFQSESITGK